MIHESYKQKIAQIDDWLDSAVGPLYLDQPLAQDWARLSKVAEELGEAAAQFILATGQNPRKGQFDHARREMLAEVADVVATGLLCIQHFVKDIELAQVIVEDRIDRTYRRMIEATR